ncbi:MAG: hypothetical protein HQL91_03715 [Magnetococcales bacterium]|nr:hypothetical protein [Magnetococcales bacterium]
MEALDMLLYQYSFDGQDDLTTFGHARVENGALELTYNSAFSTGSAFLNAPVNPIQSGNFVVEFKLRTGSEYSSSGAEVQGADGMALVFVSQPGLGGLGSALGFSGLAGYAVEFDTYHNPADPEGNHIALIRNEASNYLSHHIQNDLEDYQWHNVSFEYKYRYFSVFFDREKVLSGSLELPDSFYLGFTAATGGEWNFHSVDDLKVVIEGNVTINLSGPATVHEGETATYTVRLSELSSTDVRINYATANPTTTTGNDYTSTSGELTIAAGSWSNTFTVPVLNDAVVESDETFTVSISDPYGALPGRPLSVTTTIVDPSYSTIMSPTDHDLTLPPISSDMNVTGNDLDNNIIGNAGKNVLRGLDGNDEISGMGGNDQLYGGDDDDILRGGPGSDRMVGGNGDDTYYVDSDDSESAMIEGVNGGTDLVKSPVTWTLWRNIENLELTGRSAISGMGNSLDNSLTGNRGDNALYGYDGNDRLDGKAGQDSMFGGNGDDFYIVSNRNDRIVENFNQGVDRVESSVSFVLPSHVENLILTGMDSVNSKGNNLNNFLHGNDKSNEIEGDEGNDILQGGKGDDRLSGGDGSDQFKYLRPVEGGDDVSDFDAVHDNFVFVSRNFGNLSRGKLDSSRFLANATGQRTTRDQRFVYNTSTGVLKYDPDGSGSEVAVTMATLTGRPSLSAGNIMIVES